MTARRRHDRARPGEAGVAVDRAISARIRPGGNRAKVRTASASALVSSHASFSRASVSASARSVSRSVRRPIPLMSRINSLLIANGFPVVVELIPCSVAQGIQTRKSRKLLNSQMFSRRIFEGKRPIPKKFAVVSLLWRSAGEGLQPSFAPRPSISARKFGKLVAIIEASSTLIGFRDAMPMTKKLIAMR
jgi:hypothetical protein